MKKLISILLCFIFIFQLFGCEKEPLYNETSNLFPVPDKIVISDGNIYKTIDKDDKGFTEIYNCIGGKSDVYYTSMATYSLNKDEDDYSIEFIYNTSNSITLNLYGEEKKTFEYKRVFIQDKDICFSKDKRNQYGGFIDGVKMSENYKDIIDELLK